MTIDLLQERKNRGLSQREMAEAIGVTKRVYQSAERGGEPRGRNALKFAAYFCCAVTDLWPAGTKAAT